MINEEEKLRRWRLILGNTNELNMNLCSKDISIDLALQGIYGQNKKGNNSEKGQDGENDEIEKTSGSLEASSPSIATWLGDIRLYFQKSVVQLIQKDALEKLNLKQILLEPELLEIMEPDINLVAEILALSTIMPAEIKETAKIVVKKVVEEIEKKLSQQLIKAIKGSLSKSDKNIHPKYSEIDWNKTIKKNLKYYQPDYKTVIPVNRVGFGHKTKKQLKTVILCIDQSGSMGTSVVYSGIFSSVMASIKSLKTHVIAFDTSVVDLTEKIDDPVELLFGFQLGGGTDIAQAVQYCKNLIRTPLDTVFILITDLYEGGNKDEMFKSIEQIKQSGVNFITLLALTDRGFPSYDKEVAKSLADIGVKAFACTPDYFPTLIANALK